MDSDASEGEIHRDGTRVPLTHEEFLDVLENAVEYSSSGYYTREGDRVTFHYDSSPGVVLKCKDPQGLIRFGGIVMATTIKTAIFIQIVRMDFDFPENADNYFLVHEEEGFKIPWKGTARESILAWAREEIAAEE